MRWRALRRARAEFSAARWTSVPLGDVVARAVMALPQDRVVVSGPTVALDPRCALSMAPAINELATNALKYAALASGMGHITVTWSRKAARDAPDEPVWQGRETGVRDVATPTRRGFGRFLIEEVLASDFGGTVTRDFAPTGLCAN